MFNNNQNNRPPAFPLPEPSSSQQANDDGSWNIKNMPWKSGENSSVMLFNGLSLNNAAVPPKPVPAPSTSGFLNRQPRVKRKSESDDLIPNKQYITEEKMIAHLNSLNLSDHEDDDEKSEPPRMESYSVNLTPQELEKRLKKAQRITVCDQVIKSMREDHEIIPKALLNRIDEPCRALVLWRPPDLFEHLLFQPNPESSDEDEMDGYNNNNNNSDPNNNMDMEM